MLHNIVVVGCKHQQTIPLAMLTIKKELHGSLFLCMHMVLSMQLRYKVSERKIETLPMTLYQ